LQANVLTDAQIPFDNEDQKILFDLWNELRGERLLPMAAEVDPIKMVKLLPEVAIFDVFSRDNITYRLAGTGVSGRLGSDPTGKNLIELTDPPTREFVADLFEKISSQPVGAIVHYHNTYSVGTLAPVHSFLLPVSGGDASNPRVISLHARASATAYAAAQEATVIGTSVEETIWIDIGAGAPDDA
jgi:hypothetical protein